MLHLVDLLPLLLHTGKNIALFAGGLFAGAAIYVSLTECPPRTTLSLRELLVLAHSIAGRSAALLLLLSTVTAASALVAALAGAGIFWLCGGLVHLALSIFIIAEVRKLVGDLQSMHPDAEHDDRGEAMMRQRAAQFGVLGLGGLVAQYFFIIA